ncbi:MAG: hypothetical protein JWP02_1500 [Acidimicrobiales bacterium]|nr:hypothetical protein [Acidimicrobiales bacterium]
MATATQTPTQVMQGIEVPATSVNPEAFFRATRRLSFQIKGGAYNGLGNTDNIPVLQVGIISGLTIRFTGVLTVTLGGGTCASTRRWPYDLIRAARVSANAQSNLINCSGSKLKAREIMSRGDLTDRGVSRGAGGASPGTSVTQGTLSLASERWGIGSGVTAIPGAPTTYNVELSWFVPIAFDQLNLMGAIFAQTSATDLQLSIDWAPTTDLFVLTGAATATLAGSYQVEATVYSIPQGPNGDVIVPDLSVFHSLIQTRFATPSNGLNEIRLSGQGVGRQLLRVFGQLWNTAAGLDGPVIPDDTTYGQVGWRFGGNDTPEIFPQGAGVAAGGHLIRQLNERTFDSDIGFVFGFWCLDFASEWAMRDSIDEGAATELRILLEFPTSLALSSPYVEYVQETAFAGAVGA